MLFSCLKLGVRRFDVLVLPITLFSVFITAATASSSREIRNSAEEGKKKRLVAGGGTLQARSWPADIIVLTMEEEEDGRKVSTLPRLQDALPPQWRVPPTRQPSEANSVDIVPLSDETGVAYDAFSLLEFKAGSKQRRRDRGASVGAGSASPIPGHLSPPHQTDSQKHKLSAGQVVSTLFGRSLTARSSPGQSGRSKDKKR
jgi:hypothetical protein